MKYQYILVFVLAILSVVSAEETLFTSGLQEFAGQKYYWLAEWKLEVTLPDDTDSDDRFEVLFGSKGEGKRTLYFEHNGKSGTSAPGLSNKPPPICRESELSEQGSGRL
jgi:hypothetical protein